MVSELTQTIVLVGHIISVVLAVGAASVTDYLHLVGLRRKRLEKKFAGVYPYLSRFILGALGFIYLTGMLLVWFNPSILSSPIFITKLALVIVVTINGIILQKLTGPQLDLCVLKGTKYCTKSLLYSSAVGGSVSIITWYAILILALTKKLGYTATQFTGVYIGVLLLTIIMVLWIEKYARKWR